MFKKITLLVYPIVEIIQIEDILYLGSIRARNSCGNIDLRQIASRVLLHPSALGDNQSRVDDHFGEITSAEFNLIFRRHVSRFHPQSYSTPVGIQIREIESYGRRRMIESDCAVSDCGLEEILSAHERLGHAQRGPQVDPVGEEREFLKTILAVECSYGSALCQSI